MLDLAISGSDSIDFNGAEQRPAISLAGDGNCWQATVDFGPDGNVVFAENTVFSYASKTLSSNDHTKHQIDFTGQTGMKGRELSGSLTLTYL